MRKCGESGRKQGIFGGDIIILKKNPLRISSFKGKHHTEETKRKISEKLKEFRKNNPNFRKGKNNPNYGTYWSEERKNKHSKRMSGQNNPFYGKHLSEEQKKKIRIFIIMNPRPINQTNFNKENGGNLVPFKKGHNGYKYWKGKNKENDIRCQKISQSVMADRNHNWKGGISFEPYPIVFNNHFKENIRNRDNRICQLCMIPEGKRKLDIHHIDYNKKNCDPINLVSLCRYCHEKTNSDREYWESFFNNIILYSKIGKISEYNWQCDCPDFPKHLILCVG
jgi:hypothetical protein